MTSQRMRKRGRMSQIDFLSCNLSGEIISTSFHCSLNCKKARKQASEEKSSEEQSQEEQAKVLSSGSDKENKRRLGAESQEHTESDYEPSSKKGRQTQHQRGKGRGRGRGRGRGAGRGQASRAVPHTASDSDEDSVPLIQLRRSSRANKGQRVVEPLYSTDTTPKRKSKKEKDREERARLKAERAEKKRLRELRRQEKAAARNGKKVSADDTPFDNTPQG